MRHICAILLAVCGILRAEQDCTNSIDLGEGIVASIGCDMNCKFLYLPGREVPISIPYATWVREVKLSPNRRELLLVLYVMRHNFGSDYLCCLRCSRSDTTASAVWTPKFILHATSLDLMFDRSTWVEGVISISDDGRADLKIARGAARVPPHRINSSIERWDLTKEQRESVIESEHE